MGEVVHMEDHKEAKPENFEEGFFLVSRSILESEVFQKPNLLMTFIWCMGKASYKSKYVPVSVGSAKTTVKLERGQFIFGRNKAAEALRLPPSTVRNLMAKLSEIGCISMKKDSHYSIVTLCNYGSYQDPTNYVGQAEDSRRTAVGQAEDTNKKVKKEKKGEEDITSPATPNHEVNELAKEVITYLNKKTGKTFGTDSSANRDLVKARMNSDSANLDKFKRIIDNKVAEWKNDPKMSKFLRPSTLFSKGHFDEYLNSGQSRSGSNPIMEGVEYDRSPR